MFLHRAQFHAIFGEHSATKGDLWLFDATCFAVEDKAIFLCSLHEPNEVIIMCLRAFAKHRCNHVWLWALVAFLLSGQYTFENSDSSWDQRAFARILSILFVCWKWWGVSWAHLDIYSRTIFFLLLTLKKKLWDGWVCVRFH